MSTFKQTNDEIIKKYQKEIRKHKKQIKANLHTVSVLSNFPDEFSKEDLMKFRNDNKLLQDRIEDVTILINGLKRLA